MKKYTNTESQAKLNGYIWNVADLLKSITGKVELTLLKKHSQEFIDQMLKMGATQENVDKAYFHVCTNFNITIS